MRGSRGGADIDRRAAQDLERSVLEDVAVRMGGPVSSERRDLLVLEPLDLRTERLEDQIDEADQTRGADVLAQVEASDVPAKVRGARVGVADRPQVQGEERLRPTVGPDRDRDEMGRAVREQAHRVEVARLVVGSVAVVVDLTARVTVEDAVLPGVEAPRLDRLLARHEVNHRPTLPLQLLEKVQQLERRLHRSR